MNTKVYMSAELHTTEQFPGGHCAGMRGNIRGNLNVLIFLFFPKMSFSTEECIILLMWNSRTGKTIHGDSS